MTTYNHTAIATGAAANASTFNTPMGQLDAKMGDVAGGLTTTVKTSLVAAINELHAEHGTLTDLDTTDKDTFVDAINELHAEHGTLTDLDTTAQNTFVAAINEVYALAVALTSFDLGVASVTSATTMNLTADTRVFLVSGSATIATINPSEDVAHAVYFLNGTVSTWKLATGGNILLSEGQTEYTPRDNEVVVLIWEPTVNVWRKNYDAVYITEIIGDLGDLTTIDQSSVVAAINELMSYIGDTSLLGLGGPDLVTEVNAVSDRLGAIEDLETATQASAVAAINEIVGRLDDEGTGELVMGTDVPIIASATSITLEKNKYVYIVTGDVVIDTITPYAYTPTKLVDRVYLLKTSPTADWGLGNGDNIGLSATYTPALYEVVMLVWENTNTSKWYLVKGG